MRFAALLMSSVMLSGCAMFAPDPPQQQLKPPAGREAHMGEDYAACQIVADQSRRGSLMLDAMERPATVRNCLMSKGYTY